MSEGEAVAAVACPSCRAAVLPGEQFCEACGAPLPPDGEPGGPAAAACPSCGATSPAVDGYCPVCGMRRARTRDHTEDSGPGWAGVSDRGRRHPRNEDAFAVARRPDGRVVASLADGVSTTQRADEASASAVAAAMGVLAGPAEPDVQQAAATAREAVVAIEHQADPDLGPPSSTLLTAVVGGAVELATLGDCRAYWLDGAGAARQITTDDSWAADQVGLGSMTADEAFGDSRAHVITRWLGADADPQWRARVTRVTPTGPGRLLLCSDGLWNYLADGEALVAAVAGRTDPLETCRALVGYANERGGHDNITVVVVDWPAPARATNGKESA